MTAIDFFVSAPDGHQIFTRHWASEQIAPRAVIHISHGMAEHSGRYRPIAEALNAAGYSVFSHDHRGHGLSVSCQQQLGHFADRQGWAKVIADMSAVHQQIRQRHPGLPLIQLGHSMGSFIALYHGLQPDSDLQGLILSGTTQYRLVDVLPARAVVRLEQWRQGPLARSKLFAYLSFTRFNQLFGKTRTDSDWLSRDDQEVDKYIADPLCGFPCSNRLWLDFFEGLMALSRRKNLQALPATLPVYIMAGEKDPLSHPDNQGVRRLVKRLSQAGLSKVDLKAYPDARHEILNETNRPEVVGDMIAWLEGLFSSNLDCESMEVVSAC